jgi:hypothetical protein
MANPGYPQMGQMPPMGGPPMGGPPMGGPPMAQHRTVRRGTSKVVPVVVSAGLAVGVFCGLLFGLGTGKHDAQAAAVSGSDGSAAIAPAPAGIGATAALPVGSGAGSAAAGSAGSAAGAAAGSGSAGGAASGSAAVGSAGSAAGSAVVPEVKIAKLVVNVTPADAAATAKVEVDGAAITGTSLDVPTEKKTVHVVVKATGYHQYEHDAPLIGGQTTTLDVELIKRAPEPAHPPTSHPTQPHKPKPQGGGGLIDI